MLMKWKWGRSETKIYPKQSLKCRVFMDWPLFTWALFEISATLGHQLNSVENQVSLENGGWRQFSITKEKFYTASVLTSQDFDKLFEVECDICVARIRVVLSQVKRPVAYYIKKLSESRRKWSTYEKKFYALMRTLKHWRHYVIGKEFYFVFRSWSSWVSQ